MSEALSYPSNVIEFPGWRVSTDHSPQIDTRRAVSEERLRIARELHDVVAYGLATISVQAGVAAHILEEQPEQAFEALNAIRSTSTQALAELRTTLGTLRTVDDVEPRSCAPRLGRLDALVSSITAAGVPTELRLEGRPRQLPEAVDLAAFRIVQQSLTNVLRHAPRASAVVTIRYERDGLAVDVEDDGRGAAVGNGLDGAGHGIAGMRERVGALGGELEAGPRPEGGFRVRARIPVLGRS